MPPVVPHSPGNPHAPSDPHAPIPIPSPPPEPSRRWAAVSLIAFALFFLGVVIVADRGEMPDLVKDLIYDVPLGDKVAHFLSMGLWAFLADVACRRWRWRGWPMGSAVVGVLVVIEELTQALFPARTFSIEDLVASLLGVAAGAWLAARFMRLRPASSSPPAPDPAVPPV